MIKKVIASILISILVLIFIVGCSTTPATEQTNTPQASNTVEETGQSAAAVSESTEITSVDQINITAPKKVYKIGCTLMDLSNAYFVQVGNGYTDRMKELGFEVTLVDGKMDAAGQVAAIENFVASGCDAIIVAAADPSGIAAAVKAAIDKGVVVVAEAQEIDGASACYIVDDVEYGKFVGKAAGEWINEKLNGEAEVAILGAPELEAGIKRAQSIQDTILSLAPNAKIVSIQSALAPEAGMKAAETIFQAYPNVKVIAAVNDGGALGAYEVIKSMNKDTEDFFLGGLDATPEALEKMKEPGSVYRYTCDLHPYEAGSTCVDIAIYCIENGPIQSPLYLPMTDVNVE